MKKFIIFAVSAIFCVAVAMPALAGQVKVGGSVGLDMFYFDMDGDRQAGGTPLGAAPAGNGFEQTVIELPWAFTNINVSYTNDDKTMGAYVQVADGWFASTEAMHNIDKAFVWWKINPMLQFTFGRQASVVSPYNPWTFIGSAYNPQHSVGTNFGNMFNGPGQDQFLTSFTLSDMFSIQLGIVDPDSHDFLFVDSFAAGPVVATNGLLGPNTTRENEIPRFDLAFPLNFGPVKIVPSLTYLEIEYDQVNPGNQDDLSVWFASLAAMASFGPVTFTGEVNFGDNVDPMVSNWPGGIGARPAAYAVGATTQIADANYVGYWADLAFKFGKVTFHGIIGGQQVDCDGDPAVPQDAAEYDSTSTMYGITVPIMVSPGFFIQPELMFYDYGNDNERIRTIPGPIPIQTWTVWDDGEERVFGVQFKLIF